MKPHFMCVLFTVDRIPRADTIHDTYIYWPQSVLRKRNQIFFTLHFLRVKKYNIILYFYDLFLRFRYLIKSLDLSSPVSDQCELGYIIIQYLMLTSSRDSSHSSWRTIFSKNQYWTMRTQRETISSKIFKTINFLISSSGCDQCELSYNSIQRPDVENFERFISFFLQDNPDEFCVKGGHAAYGQVSYLC